MIMAQGKHENRLLDGVLWHAMAAFSFQRPRGLTLSIVKQYLNGRLKTKD